MSVRRYQGSKQELGKIRIKPDAVKLLKKRIEDAWAEVIAELDYEFLVVISDPEAFSELGFIDQDIIDTGRFKDSQHVDVVTIGNVIVAKFFWNPVSPEDGYHYAAALYFGFAPYGGPGYCPGRPWVDKAVKNINPVERLCKELKKRGINAKVTRNNVNSIAI